MRMRGSVQRPAFAILTWCFGIADKGSGTDSPAESDAAVRANAMLWPSVLWVHHHNNQYYYKQRGSNAGEEDSTLTQLSTGAEDGAGTGAGAVRPETSVTVTSTTAAAQL